MMDYRPLAAELVSRLFEISKNKPQRKMHQSMRGEAFVLQYVIYHKGAVAPSEISHFMNISTARMAVTLNGLERKGLVTRRIDPADRRRILVDLTETGLAFAMRQQSHLLWHATQIVEKLGEHDAEEFVRLIGRVADIIDAMHGDDGGG
ncbi:MAG: MarR family transcriptional regulator [Eubacteriales bacterium]|nr:MarR family transcriptional regulator [Eubacteriales bacterium]